MREHFGKFWDFLGQAQSGHCPPCACPKKSHFIFLIYKILFFLFLEWRNHQKNRYRIGYN